MVKQPPTILRGLDEISTALRVETRKARALLQTPDCPAYKNNGKGPWFAEAAEIQSWYLNHLQSDRHPVHRRHGPER